jgi:hypothetical protein
MMDEQTNTQQPEPTKHEQLYNILQTYRFGAISFLELLDRFEEVLDITPSEDQTDDQPAGAA